MKNVDSILNSKSQIKDINKYRKYNFRIVLLASIVAILNVLFSDNYVISTAIVLIELSILSYHFVKRDITRYIGCYLIFLCLSFEFNILVGSEQLYGFKNFRIFGINLGIITLIPIVFLAIIKGLKLNKIKSEFPQVYEFAKKLFFLNSIGLIVGLFQILINDNNIQNMENFIFDFIGISYSMIIMPLFMLIVFLYLLSWEKEKIKEIDIYLIAILIAIVVSMVISFITGRVGWYGGIKTLLVADVVIYIPFMLLIPFYNRYRYSNTLMMFGIIGLVFSLLYNTSGKLLMLYILMPVGILGIILRKKKITSLIICCILLPILMIFSIMTIQTLQDNSLLFKIKLEQVSSMLRIWNSNWLLDMPLSPRTRIVEFLNIVHEYVNKPWFVLLGKGYMGTVIDHTNILSSEFVESAYSMNQWDNGTFYRVHETFNLLFLYNGLLGIVFYFNIVKDIFINFTKSLWILVGGFWFIMFYGFSVTITAYGMMALLFGYIDIDNKTNLS